MRSARPLDFWLGDWAVYAGGAFDGNNHTISILGGCAIQEEWTDITGYQGRSWFYVGSCDRAPETSLADESRG